MSFNYIISERVDGVVVIILNRPEKLNALSFELMQELDQAFIRIASDDEITCVVLTGAGERAFSAGADIHEMAGMDSEELEQRQAFRNAATWRLATFTKPIIGAINGIAYGGAALISSMLDVRIGCERTAFRFLAASYGRVNSTWSLPTIIGLPKAKELLYTGRSVEHEEAERIGLLNHVVPATQLMAHAIEMGHMISNNDQRMVQGIKRLLHEDIGLSWRDRYENEEEARDSWLTSAHPKDGFKDFLSRKEQRG